MAGDRINGLPLGGVQQTGFTKQELLRKNISTGQSFQTLLEQQLQKNEPLKFSKHAQERISQRGITLSTELLTGLRGAVEKARSKGARDLVVLNSDSVFIVNVPSSTVVTTMAGSEMKDNIITNIDSAVIL